MIFRINRSNEWYVRRKEFGWKYLTLDGNHLTCMTALRGASLNNTSWGPFAVSGKGAD
jgi:hypothetical protein